MNKKMNKTIFTIQFILFSFALFAQTNEPDSGKVDWISLQEAQQKFAEKAKPIIIYIHDTGEESKAMADTTFKQFEVTNYMNVRFYNVKINAYTKDKITYLNGQTFENKTGKIHDFVKFILNNDVKLPAMVVLNVDGFGSAYKGYKSRDAIFPILIYTSEKIYKSTTYDDWFTHYDKTYPSDNKRGYTMTRSLVKWLPFEEAIEKNKTQKRKFFVDIYANWVVGATVMFIATYNNPDVAKILNENYYPVRLNALSRDTITVKGITYTNKGEANTYHDLPVAMLEGKMNFPAFIILNEDLAPLIKNSDFHTSKSLEPLLMYFAEEKYKTNQKYKEYYEEYLKKKEEKE